MTTWDTTVDFVMRRDPAAAAWSPRSTAVDAGASALVLEKQELVGGSTCMSGGIVWVPDNPVMRADGVPDSYEDAMAHFEAVVGDVGPASSFERRHAFLTGGRRDGVVPPATRACGFVHCPGYSDYYSERHGRPATSGAGIEPVPCDGRALGDRGSAKLQPGLAQSLGLAVMTNEARSLSTLQPQRRRLRRLGPGRAPHRGRPGPAVRPC